MKNMMAVILIIAPLAARAEMITEREFEHLIPDVAPDGLVEIDNVAGAITIHGNTERRIRIRAKLGDRVEGLQIDNSEGTVSITVVNEDYGHGHNGGEAELEIWVPEQSELAVTGVSADIDVVNVRGAQRLKSVSGDIAAEAHDDGEITAAAVSGSVRIEGKGAPREIRLESVSGDVEGNALGGNVEAHSVSGDVVITESRIRRGKFASTSGDIDVAASLGAESRLDFETVSGDVELRVRGEKDGAYDISTFSGNIENCFGPKPEVKDPLRRHRFALGNEKARVRVATMSGNVSVCD